MDGEPLLTVLCRETGRLIVQFRYSNPFDTGGMFGGTYLPYTPFMDDRYLEQHSEKDFERIGAFVLGLVAAVLAYGFGALAFAFFRDLIHRG